MAASGINPDTGPLSFEMGTMEILVINHMIFLYNIQSSKGTGICSLTQPEIFRINGPLQNLLNTMNWYFLLLLPDFSIWHETGLDQTATGVSVINTEA